MNKVDMEKLGFNDKFLAESALHPDMYVGRVFSQYKDTYSVFCQNNEIKAKVSGRFRFEVKNLLDYPAVGDFVMLDRDTNINGNAIIHNVISRKSAFIRKAAGRSNDSQVVASNIDTVFICMSLNSDFSLRRIERYLSIAWDSGAVPVIVLTKADLCNDIEQKLLDINSVALGVEVLVTSGLLHDGYSQILKYIIEGKTIAFIGSSGVGKSTLVNCLLGEIKIETGELRNDDKGRHTTTKRELIVLPHGGIVIDTPGMRELGIETADLSKSFPDIDELSGMCKFRDCTHTTEPSCAVQEAIENGVISLDRFISYQKLKKETESVKAKDMSKGVGGIKNAKKFSKGKNSREQD